MSNSREIEMRAKLVAKDLVNIYASVIAMVTTVKLLFLELWIFYHEIYVLIRNMKFLIKSLLKFNSTDDNLSRLLKCIPGVMIYRIFTRYIFHGAFLILFNQHVFYKYTVYVLLWDFIYVMHLSIAYAGINTLIEPTRISMLFSVIAILHVIVFIFAMSTRLPFVVALIINMQSIEAIVFSLFYIINSKMKRNSQQISEIERERLMESLKKMVTLGLNYYCYIQYVLNISSSRYAFILSFIIAYNFFCVFDQFKKLKVSMQLIRKYTKVLSINELRNEISTGGTCCICLDSHDFTSRKLVCHHMFHLNCLSALVQANQDLSSILTLRKKYHCPLCNAVFNSTRRHSNYDQTESKCENDGKHE